MSRLIDAEWILNFFEPYPNDYQTPLGLLRACIDDAPSIDIVRCKECKYAEVSVSPITGLWCTRFNDMAMEDDDFCSHGQRKESE